MKNTYHYLILPVLLLVSLGLRSQNVSSNCATTSVANNYTGEVFFNYGSGTNLFSTTNRTSATVGQPVVDYVVGQEYSGNFGFWSRFLLAPSAPVVTASEGDLEDRIQVKWAPDLLSSAASGGFNIYRNGALLAQVGPQIRTYIDFNVLAGKFYTYEVAAVNSFGEGYKGSSIGFLNPNGVVTGQVKTTSGNPVVGASVVLTPTIGTAIEFKDKASLFALHSPALSPGQFTVSCWMKLGDGNQHAGIIDFGSAIGKNWWLHTTSADTLGIAFSIGNGLNNTKTLRHKFTSDSTGWHYIAATYNSSSLLLYVDGELVQTIVGSMQTDSTTLFFGKRGNSAPGGDGYFNGKLDEVRIFNRQLQQTELQMFMNRTVPADAKGLQAYWKFDEGVGSKGFDQTANKLTAYLCGALWTAEKPDVVNAGITDTTGSYKIAGINYGGGTTFTATPSKNFYFNQSLEFNAVNQSYADLTKFDLPDSASLTLTVKAFDFSGDQIILSKADSLGSNQFMVGLKNGNVEMTVGNQMHQFGSLTMGFHHLAFTMGKDSTACL